MNYNEVMEKAGVLRLNNPRTLFADRREAGEKLAPKLARYRNSGALVLAIPRGGVEVAAPVARALFLALDVIVVRKLPIPWNEEMGFGAVTADGAIILDEPLTYRFGLTRVQVEVIAGSVRGEIERRYRLYRGDRPVPDLKGRTVIIVDDGLATGYTMLAAMKSARNQRAERIVAAVPVASSRSVPRIAAEADEFIALAIAETLEFAVADYYRYWTDLTDEEVISLLQRRSDSETDPSPSRG